ncbi:MAG: TonB-dependent receptor [Bacteroidia bacterium]
MPKALLFIIGLLCTLLAESQTVKVVDQDLFPINEVQIASNGNLLGYTDSNGDVWLPLDSLKEQSLVFIHQSYHPKIMSHFQLTQNEYIVVLYLKTGTISPIRVSSGRVKRLRTDLASTTERLKSKDIVFFQPQSAADLIGAGEKVYIQKSQMGGGSPMIRGFATNRILLVVDDVRMNTAIFRSGNVHNSLSIDPFNIEETEVLFGPSSQFYGSDAIGGVLNFKTRSIELSSTDTHLFVGNASTRLSTVNREKTIHVDFMASSKSFGSYTGVSIYQFGNLQMGSNGPDFYLRPDIAITENSKDSIALNPDPETQYFTRYSQVNLIQKFYWKIEDELRLDLSSQFSNIPSNPRYDRLIVRGENDSLTYARWEYGPQIWLMNRAQLLNNNKTKAYNQFKLTMAHQLFKESRIDRKLLSEWTNTREETVNAFSVNADFSKIFKNKIKLNYGFEYLLNVVNSEGERENVNDGGMDYLRAIPSRYPNDSKWQSSGIYLNFFKKINRWYIIESGVRYNWFTINGELDTSFYPFPFTSINSNSNALTASMAQLFFIGSNKIGLITSTAYRAPNIDDVAKIFDSSPGIVIIPNPSLKPEYAYNAEITYESPINRELRLQVSIYYTYLNNAIGRTVSNFNGNDSIIYDGVLSQVQQLNNLNYASVYGSQASLQWQIDSSWKLKTSYNIMNSSSSTGEPIRHISPNFGATHLIFSKNAITVDAYVNYQSKFTSDRFSNSELSDAYLYLKDEQGQPYTPSFAVFNIKAQYEINKRWILNLGLENILDKRYRVYASGITAPGRNLSLAAKVNF